MEDTAPDRDDIVSLLTEDHEIIRRSFEATAGGAGSQRADLGRRYSHPGASGPTHPHPSPPDTPPGNLVAGPVAALFDRIRDAASHV